MNGTIKTNVAGSEKDKEACRKVEAEQLKAPDLFIGVRHIQTVLFFSCVWIGYTMKTVMPVAVVAMTEKDASSNPDVPTYSWTNKNVVLSSFYWGYICTQFIAGQLGRRYGPKWFLAGGMLSSTAGTMLIPVAADYLGSEGVMACRVVVGLALGFTFPCVSILMSKWAPLPERTRTGSFVYSGVPFSTVITMPITGLISSSWAGWPTSFYFFGALGLIWTVVWVFYGADSPAEHKTISDEERYYIEKSLNQTEDNFKHMQTPWRGILTSLPVWAIFIADLGYNWAYSTLINEIPTYMNKIMGFDMKANGFLSALPYVAFWVVCVLCGQIQDFLINKGHLSRTKSRKLFNTLATYFTALALLWLAFIPGDEIILSVTLLVCAVGASAGSFSGFFINHLDLSPNFSGTLLGVTNGLSHVFAMLAPLAVHAIVHDEEDISLWRTVFLIAAGITTAAGTFYLFFASGKIQKWNYVKEGQQEMQENPNQSLPAISVITDMNILEKTKL